MSHTQMSVIAMGYGAKGHKVKLVPPNPEKGMGQLVIIVPLLSQTDVFYLPF